MLIRWRIVWQVQMIKNIPRGVHSFAISQRLSIIYGNDLCMCSLVLSPVAEIREETSTTTSFQLFISPFHFATHCEAFFNLCPNKTNNSRGSSCSHLLLLPLLLLHLLSQPYFLSALFRELFGCFIFGFFFFCCIALLILSGSRHLYLD